ncbi:hypothetical protein BDZ97DRAFT_1775683 [Flammula alnicola]|nr:hypothetical protein BDZ97DRAFT_1775683 [Flammula alnicola]
MIEHKPTRKETKKKQKIPTICIIMLPNELFIQILGNLDYQNLLACMEVCSKFRDLIIGTASLQYIIELAVSGQRDRSQSCTTSSADQLQCLENHQSAWKNLKWSRELKIPMADGGLWELFGGVLAQTTPQGELVFHQLPSDLRGIEERSWKLGPDFGMRVRDFAIDPPQDLLVLMESPNGEAEQEYRLHLRSLSTGKPHPLAKNAVLSLPQVESDIEVSYNIQIFGDLIGVYFFPSSIPENEVGLWDWKTSELLVNIFHEDLHSFSLLSDRWIVLSLVDEDGRPLLHAINFREESSERLEIYDAETGQFFVYPPLDEDSWVHSFEIRADPGFLSGENTTVSFSRDAEYFILVLTISLTVGHVDKNLIHFVPSTHLLSVLEDADDFHDWESWIPGDTRMQMTSRLEPSNVWVCYVYGTKFVTAEPALGGKCGLSVRLYDFNDLALRRDAQRSDESEAHGFIETSSSIIAAGNPFYQDIITDLPYWSNVLHLEDAHGHCKVMCSEDNIVIVDVECREYRVLVF